MQRGPGHQATNAAADPTSSKQFYRLNKNKDEHDKEVLKQKEQKMTDKGLPCEDDLDDF